MAQWRRRGCVLLALALLVTGALSPAFAWPSLASQIDVRDLQQISTALLSGDAPNTQADFNHDGRVDILDFQCAVNQAAGQADSSNDSAPPSAPAQPAPTRALTRVCLAIQGAPRLVIPVVQATPSQHPIAALHAATPSELLYQLGRSANAPPRA